MPVDLTPGMDMCDTKSAATISSMPSVFPVNHRSRKRWAVCFICSMDACSALSADIMALCSAIIVSCSGLEPPQDHSIATRGRVRSSEFSMGFRVGRRRYGRASSQRTNMEGETPP
jgi:hypothetical protein